MISYKERPLNRKKIEKFLSANPHISLSDIARNFYIDGSGRQHYLWFTSGMRTQARRMVSEVRKNSRVHLDGKCIGFDTGKRNYVYRFLLSRCDTERKILHWIHHLARKKWVTSEMLDDFITLACRYHNINLPVGVEK